MDGGFYIYIIFTDIGGTLLDSWTYSYAPAIPALRILRESGVPVVVSASETGAEIEAFRHALSLHHPFISENGGAIYIPEGYFTVPFEYTRSLRGFSVIEIGAGYQALREALRQVERDVGCRIVGFGDMTPEEISSESGLSLKAAEMAKMREYDEAFKIPDRTCTDDVLRRIEELGFRWTRGGRYQHGMYFHIQGHNDKRIAVGILTELFRQQVGEVTTIGLGDSLNDLPMLSAVDIPILVQKPDGSYEDLGIDAHLAGDIGPSGWNKAVLGILEQAA